uniref:SJCHGC06187 protein n=1 Tax=Schistosoma japonicum TaxID=6182 RepID=Q5DE68_SCHJA|nr:SJCHGC06187 protein [Schistosoma japonicum]CAX74962.1 hypothetical protein [Schistosoma japonicum]CAX74963.1 hypothetical protein [Schistosoma japonicum]
MKITCLDASKDAGFLTRTNKKYGASTYRARHRRRNWSSHTSRLSPCVEESSKVDRMVTNSLNGSPERLSSNPPSLESSNSCSVGSCYGVSSPFIRLSMPPGPPTSPVPSPPPTPVTLGPIVEVSASSVAECRQSDRVPNLPAALRSRFRRRRNAICDSSALGQGLKDFFSSYVVSNLTDSMTSSLSLESSSARSMFRSSLHSNVGSTVSNLAQIDRVTSLCMIDSESQSESL